MKLRSFALALATSMSLVAGAGTAAEGLDWEKYAQVRVIEVITVDPDEDVRQTKVWFVMIDGVPYLRTSGSRWLANIERDPKVVIRIQGREFPQFAHVVAGKEIIDRVDAASREKYGWQEALIHVFRIKPPTILRLSPSE